MLGQGRRIPQLALDRAGWPQVGSWLPDAFASRTSCPVWQPHIVQRLRQGESKPQVVAVKDFTAATHGAPCSGAPCHFCCMWTCACCQRQLNPFAAALAMVWWPSDDQQPLEAASAVYVLAPSQLSEQMQQDCHAQPLHLLLRPCSLSSLCHRCRALMPPSPSMRFQLAGLA